MARQPRLVVAGYPHHVIQRGNNRQPIVLDDRDRSAFLAELRRAAADHRLLIHAYVLMDNHVHLLATPEAPTELGRAMQALGRRYVGWFNHRYGRSGGLWEGRYKASIVETDRYFLACQRYIELNPVRASLVASAAEYRWSSARHHLGMETDQLVSDHSVFWALGNTPFDRQAAYRALLEQGQDGTETQWFTRATLAGRVLGSDVFIHRLSALTDRSLVPRPRGRPKRVSPDSVPINDEVK